MSLICQKCAVNIEGTVTNYVRSDLKYFSLKDAPWLGGPVEVDSNSNENILRIIKVITQKIASIDNKNGNGLHTLGYISHF